MGLGHRAYIVENGGITRLSQKTFDRFLRHEPVLLAFANRTVDLAVVFYELKNRRPSQIVRIDLSRHLVTRDGSLDLEYFHEASRLYINRMDREFGQAAARPVAGVVDAAANFDERRIVARHRPALTGPLHKKILEDLFGTAR